MMILILTLALAASAHADDAARLDLTGTWVLDEHASDDVVETLKAAMGSMGGRGGKGGAMGGRGGGRGIRGGGRGGRGGMGGGMNGGAPADGDRPDPSARLAARAEQILDGARRLEIFHAGDELNITDGTGLSQLLICGEESQVWTQGGERTAVTAWDGDVLRVTMKAPEGGRGPGVGASYALVDDSLVVTRYMSSPRSENGMTLKFVYAREN
jgi:hypothetical protein